LCVACGTSFTFERKTARSRARFTDDVMEEAVRLYIQGLSSYRVLAVMLEQRLGRSVSRVTLNGWVQELGERAKTPLEVSMELQPKWGGFLGIDGKVIRVKGDKRCLLIGVDHPTQDLVHALVLEAETADGFARLATEARLDAGHPLTGVVSDLGAGFAQAHRDHFGSVPFQACRIHFDRRLDQEIPKSLWSAKAPLYAELKERIRAVLYAPDYEAAAALLQALTHDRVRFKGIGKINMIRSLERSFDLFMTHHFTSGCLPTTMSLRTSSSSSTRSSDSWKASRASNQQSATRACSWVVIASSVSPTRITATTERLPWSSPASTLVVAIGFRSC